MSKATLVFVLGYNGVGKDTVANILVSKGYKRISFADALKSEYAKEHNLDVQLLHQQGPIKEAHRPGLIKMAEDRKKMVHPWYWLIKAFEPSCQQIDHTQSIFCPDKKLVVSDFCRIAEAEWILAQQNNSSVDIRVLHLQRSCPWEDPLTTLCIEKAQEHNLIDYCIANNGTIEQLSDKLDEVCVLLNI